MFGYGLTFENNWLSGLLADGSEIQVPVFLAGNASLNLMDGVQVPEPGPLSLIVLGLIGMTLRRHRLMNSPSHA